MDCVHIKNLEKYHPGYKDRVLQWAKVYFNVISGDPDWDLIDNEIDKWRLIAMICLELRAQKPLPNIDSYWSKYFNIKKRQMSLTLNMLHNFIVVVTVDRKLCCIDKEKDKEKEGERESVTEPRTHQDFVLLKDPDFEKLVSTMGRFCVLDYIDRLNNYIGSSGKRYRSHYHTILSWWRKDGKPLNQKDIDEKRSIELKEKYSFDAENAQKVQDLIKQTTNNLSIKSDK